MNLLINTWEISYINVEQNLIGESVGCQDQIHAAHGGFNHIEFFNDGSFKVNPVIIKPETSQTLQDYCLLFFTGFSRFASGIASEQIKKTPEKKKELNCGEQLCEHKMKNQ